MLAIISNKIYMSKEFPKLDISKIFAEDIEEIFSSRKKSKILHSTNDIDASGDEIENTIRRVIKRKLPIKYYVSQGHITDRNSTTSNQLDLIIADNSGSPVLFTSENGTEYFPYESIYSFAEIKSTYYKSKEYIEDFVRNNKRIYTQLERAETKPDQITQEIKFNLNKGLSITRNDKRSYQNPLFKFMCFVDSNDFKLDHFKEISKMYDDKYLPNIICFLDKGVIAKAKVVKTDKGYELGRLELHPEFIEKKDKDKYKWVFLDFSHKEGIPAATLAFLIFFINEHLKNCLVLKPNILKYFNSMFSYNGQFIN